MTDESNIAETTLTVAENALAAAALEAVRAEHLAELLAQPGLTYGPVDDGRTQDQYVTYNGERIGMLRRTTAGASPLLDWYAADVDGNEFGPFLTARIGAAALMRRHVAEVPDVTP